MVERPGDRFRIEPLGDGHERSVFACGVLALDHYLQRQATQDVRRRFAAVFVAVDGSGTVVGYYTLSMSAVSLDLLPDPLRRKMPRYPTVPAVRLGRLAVNSAVKGIGLGQFLLLDAMSRSLASEIAWAAFVVDAEDDAARSFYLQYGFMELADDPRHLFLPHATVQAALSEHEGE